MDSPALTVSSWQGPAGLVVPRLTATPKLKGLAGGSRTRAQLALALLDAEIAPATLWNGQPEQFAQRALTYWIQQRGGDAVAKRFDIHVGLERPNLREPEETLFLYVVANSAAQLRLRSAYRYLDGVHRQLPATVDRAIGELNHCIRVFDRFDAEEWRMFRLEAYEDEEIAVEIKPIEIPTSLSRAALKPARVRRLLKTWPRVAQRVGERALDVARLAHRFGERWPWDKRLSDDAAEYFMDCERPLPCLIVAFAEHDLIEAAFDDEAQSWYQSDPAPTQAWEIAPTSAASVRRAFDGLADWLEVMAAAASLMNALPGQGQYAFDGGLPLLDVLAAEDAA